MFNTTERKKTIFFFSLLNRNIHLWLNSIYIREYLRIIVFFCCIYWNDSIFSEKRKNSKKNSIMRALWVKHIMIIIFIIYFDYFKFLTYLLSTKAKEYTKKVCIIMLLLLLIIKTVATMKVIIFNIWWLSIISWKQFIYLDLFNLSIQQFNRKSSEYLSIVLICINKKLPIAIRAFTKRFSLSLGSEKSHCIKWLTEKPN